MDEEADKLDEEISVKGRKQTLRSWEKGDIIPLPSTKQGSFPPVLTLTDFLNTFYIMYMLYNYWIILVVLKKKKLQNIFTLTQMAVRDCFRKNHQKL